MSISNKARKLLWGRSGNRCAICRRELTIESTLTDDETVVGDECHIVSEKPGGPRFDSAFPFSEVDSLDNLILLCKVHHKMVDDQPREYTADRLRVEKKRHEEWVSKKLTDAVPLPPVRFRRLKENAPSHLEEINSGKELFTVLRGALSYHFDCDEPNNKEEAELLSGFFQEMQDWGDLSHEFEAGEGIMVGFNLNQTIDQVHIAGFRVFGGKEVQLLEGGNSPPEPWPIAIIRVVRSDSQEIIQVRTHR